jgi:hypothetical protein
MQLTRDCQTSDDAFTLTAPVLNSTSEQKMKNLRKRRVGSSVLIWSISIALCAGAAAGQVLYQTNSLLSSEQPLHLPSQSQKFDEYGDIRFNDEKARLDNFAIALQNDPTSVGYIIGYGGSTCRVGEAMARASRAKDYLTNSRGFDAGRIITRNGGYRNEVGAELYVVPLGGAEPSSRPTIPRCKPKPKKSRR